ncbi:MAG: DEAD/DEAH box helicase [Promethearchaeota archaeon]|nr:MAG: DEAD/DEAH box helicase [Candidatus Lokiarchaeota archaeon]
MFDSKTNQREQKAEDLFSQDELEIRKYQIDISNQCVNKNSLVVLPTGLGKTIIAAMVAARTLENFPPKSKVIILAPTRPLIDQHYYVFLKYLKISEDLFSILTGKVAPKFRTELYHQNQILFYTPHTLRNDLSTKKYTLKDTCLIIFDEAHHASGDYPYTLIAEEYLSQTPDGNILALTASPGASKKKITELCQNLHIPVKNIHIRTRKDTDVKGYLKPMDIYKIGVDLTEIMKDSYEEIKKIIEIRLHYLSQLGFLEKKTSPLVESVIRKDLLNLNNTLINLINNSKTDDSRVYSAISITAQALILYHMIELIEQQGLDILLIYLEKVYIDARKKNSSKALKVLASEQALRRVYIELKKNERYNPENLIHPKFKILENIILKEFDRNSLSKILVFVKLRDSVINIVEKLSKYNSIRPTRFVGQTTRTKNDKGLSQKEQISILERFKQGDYNVLVSTNVGEEGLDIAECDLVVFYDVVSSEIRLIQRKGRTARHRKGKVIILYCKGTNDETYLYIALNKLKKMNVNLKNPSSLQKNRNNPSSQKNSHPLEAPDEIIPQEKRKEKKESASQTKYGLNRFIYKGNGHRKDFEVSALLPMGLGIRKELEKEGISFQTADSPIHLVLFEKIAIQIYNAKRLRTNGNDILFAFWNSIKNQYKLIIFIVTFFTFENKFEGENRLLRKTLHKSHDEMQFELITIDTIEELYFIIKNIYSHNK